MCYLDNWTIVEFDCYESSGVHIIGTGIDFIPTQTKSNALNLFLRMGQHCWSDIAIRYESAHQILHTRYASAHQVFMQNTPQLSSCTTSTQLLCPDPSEYI